MSKHQLPTHSFFAKRPRVATYPSDTANDHQLAVVDPKIHAPNDISNSPRDGPTQLEMLKYPVDANDRKFRKEWFVESTWLEYSQTRDAVFCFACRHFGLGNIRLAWCTTGFNNWMKAIEKFFEHNCSEAHKHAMAAWIQWMSYYYAVSRALLRGHRESDEEPSHVNKGNFLVILDLLARHDPIVARRLHEGPQNAKYTHHSIQDNIIRVAALLIREQIAVETSGNYYAIIADESRDTGHKEQMSLVLRYVVQEDGIQGRHVIKESFLGFASCESLAAAGLCETLLTSLRDCGIDLLGCVAQCFDEAAVMSGRCSGVQTRIRELCPKAIYVHCFTHRLNLVIVDVVHNTARADDLFILLQSLHNFLSSPIVHEQYVKAQRSRFPDSQPREIPSLSDTRWVCRHDACETIIVTLPAVIDVLESLMDVSGLRGATARSMMVQLNTSFVIHLCIFSFLLKICADASAKLQGKSETLDEALQAIKTVCSWLDRPEIPQMDEVWEGIYNQAQDIVRVTELPQPQVRRVREVGGPVGLESSEDYRREVFVPMCNKTLAELQRRFLSEENQAVYGGVCALTPGSDSFLNVEQIWLMCNFYGVAKKCNAVKTEIDLLRITFENGGDDLPTDLMGMLNFIEPHKRVLDKVLHIAVTIPVASAQAERSFSAMKRIKNFLRSTMGNTRLSDIGVLNVNAEMLCALNKESIISRFAEKPHRILL